MKAKKIILKVLITVAALVLAVLLLLQIGVTVKYWDFYMESQRGFVIPGLTTNFVPQGFDYIQEAKIWLMSGYMTDKEAGRVYFRNSEGETQCTLLLNEDGTAYTEHAGGICHNDNYAYLPAHNGVDVFLLSDVLSGSTAKKLGTIPTEYDMAFCSIVDGYLLTGDFYYPEYYETPEHHRLETPAGDKNTGVISVFKVDPKAEFGIDPVAVAAISTREMVQGLCVTDDGRIVLSTSWGLNDSQLFVYELDKERQGTMETVSGTVPLYYLDSANLVETVTAPPMAEELVFHDGKVWILNESACNKYLFGRFIRGYWVYGYEMN